jgi:hypothetical protein
MTKPMVMGIGCDSEGYYANRVKEGEGDYGMLPKRKGMVEVRWGMLR